ncbi:senescence/dehydration-associated protein-related [Striga asiatica]|uniref:Senescence/dehydration-associated protein-related n=1 Tax=Striga asiatica TaxID=4170 RepID=A0A5A7QYW9_STRAF|nr:senescence/dehydration-associated protein-related [Striga asiatica]
MAYQNPQEGKSLYPQVIQTNPDQNPWPPSSSSSSSLYPSIEMKQLAENLFPETEEDRNPKSPTSFESSEEVLVKIPGAILHLIDRQRSLELARGDFTVVQLKQGGTVVAAMARVGGEIQWPLAKDEAAVKLDEAHYFFSLRVPNEADGILNYGLTIAAKGQEGLLKKLDSVLENFSAFRVEGAAPAEVQGWWAAVARGVSPEEMERKPEEVEKSAAAYWTTIAPNVEDYGGSLARMIAAGSGQVVRGILWCGDLTVDRLTWGKEFLSKRMGTKSNSDVSPEALRRVESLDFVLMMWVDLKFGALCNDVHLVFWLIFCDAIRVKRMTKMSEKVATGILSGVVKVSGFFTSSVANSKVGQKFFSLLPGEIVLASLDGFNRVCDAVEVAGKNVMSTTSVVTTGLVSQKYGEQAAKATHDGLGAAGHAIGTAWAVFKIRKALNPKGVLKPTTLAKAAVEANSAKLKAKK